MVAPLPKIPMSMFIFYGLNLAKVKKKQIQKHFQCLRHMDCIRWYPQTTPNSGEKKQDNPHPLHRIEQHRPVLYKQGCKTSMMLSHFENARFLNFEVWLRSKILQEQWKSKCLASPMQHGCESTQRHNCNATPGHHHRLGRRVFNPSKRLSPFALLSYIEQIRCVGPKEAALTLRVCTRPAVHQLQNELVQTCCLPFTAQAVLLPQGAVHLLQLSGWTLVVKRWINSDIGKADDAKEKNKTNASVSLTGPLIWGSLFAETIHATGTRIDPNRKCSCRSYKRGA